MTLERGPDTATNAASGPWPVPCPIDQSALTMDLNELLDAHQRAVMQMTSDTSASGKHATKAAIYAARIRHLRDGRSSAGNDPPACDTNLTVFAGRSGAVEALPGTGLLAIWESEGGALEVLHPGLPCGITMILRPE